VQAAGFCCLLCKQLLLLAWCCAEEAVLRKMDTRQDKLTLAGRTASDIAFTVRTRDCAEPVSVL